MADIICQLRMQITGEFPLPQPLIQTCNFALRFRSFKSYLARILQKQSLLALS